MIVNVIQCKLELVCVIELFFRDHIVTAARENAFWGV